MPRKLAVVTDDTPAPKKPTPTKIKEAVDGTERDVLVALRRKLAAELDNGPPPHTLAPLVRQLREIDRDLRALDVSEAEEDDTHDADGDDTFDASAI